MFHATPEQMLPRCDALRERSIFTLYLSARHAAFSMFAMISCRDAAAFVIFQYGLPTRRRIASRRPSSVTFYFHAAADYHDFRYHGSRRSRAHETRSIE